MIHYDQGWNFATDSISTVPKIKNWDLISYSRKFDPKAEFIRKWCPELMKVDSKYVHAPWYMPEEEQTRCEIEIRGDEEGVY